MKKIILIISIAIVLFSCKITKQTTTDAQTTTVEQKEVSTQTNETRSDNSVIEIDENEQVTITVFSLPDSSGRQYVTSITEIQKNKTLSGKKNIIEEKETIKQEESKMQKTESIKVAEKAQTETKTPWGLYVVAGIFLLGLLFILFYWLIGYKIIK